MKLRNIATFVAHAAPSIPIGRRRIPNDGRSIPKMNSGSRIRLEPKPTIIHAIEPTALPSERIIAEKPNARWLKICEKTTSLR